jgi:hypothetical protein
MKKVLFLFYFPYYMFSQHVINDAGLRLSIGLEKKITKKLDFDFKVASRFEDNFLQFNRIYFRPGISYRLTKNLDILARFSYMYTRSGYKPYKSIYRYAYGMSLKADIGQNYKLSNRLTYQNTSSDLLYDDDTEQKKTGVIRNRIILKRKLNRRNTIYIGDELQFVVNGKKEKYFSRNRVYIGNNHKLTSNLELNTYFILEKSHHQSNRPQERIFFYGIDLCYFF